MSLNGKFIKITSQETSNYTATNNRVRFMVPAGNYDLTRSYVNVYSEMDITPVAAVAAQNPVYNVQPSFTLTGTTDKVEIYPETLVKNCRVKCSKSRYSEDIRRVDILTQNLEPFIKSNNELDSEDYYKLQVAFNKNNTKFNKYVELSADGNTPSRYREVPTMLKLNKLFSGVSQVPESFGDLHYELELNINKVSVEPVPPLVLDTTTTVQDITATADNQEVSSFNVETVPQYLQSSPFYNGQHLKLTYTIAGGGATTKDVVVSSISQTTSGAAAIITITTAEPIATIPATGNVFAISLVQIVQPTASAINFTRAEMVLFQSDTPYSVSGNTYTTITTEERTFANNSSFYNQYEVESNAVNALLMPVYGDLLCNSSGLQSARFRLNNNDLSDRDITVLNSSKSIDYNTQGAQAVNYLNPNGLYYSMLNDTLLNMGLMPKNYSSRVRVVAQGPSNAQYQQNKNYNHSLIQLFAVKMMATQQMKLLNVELQSTIVNLNHVVLFKQVVKQL